MVIKNQPFILMIIILLLAWVPRILGLENDSLWNNEILSYNRATRPTLLDAYVYIRDTAVLHPPLYSIGILRPWFALGQDEFFQRFPSAVFGMLAIALTFALGKVGLNNKIGVLGGLFLAILPLHIYYSREGRMYTLLVLLTLLWVYCLMKAIRNNSWKYWGGIWFLEQPVYIPTIIPVFRY